MSAVKTAWDQSVSLLFALRRTLIFGQTEALPRSDKERVRFVGPRLAGASTGVEVPPMPRYFFNTRIGDELISDPDGEVLSDPDRAWEMARAMIQRALKTEGADGALLSATIEVTDDEGRSCWNFPSPRQSSRPLARLVTKH